MGLPISKTDALALTFIAALIYYFSYLSSYQLSSLYEFSHATSWIYLPSGIRLLLVLILMGSGALGIVLGTLAIDYFFNLSTDHVYNLVTAIVAGSSAYLSLRLAQQLFKLQHDLSSLKQAQLFGICVVFSVVSPLMHQIWYWMDGETPLFWRSLAVMALGDLGGSVIVLGSIHWLLKLLRYLRTI